MNTNNAPERYETYLIGGDYYLAECQDGWLIATISDHTILFHGDELAVKKEFQDFAAAMQPQVSEGDEDVAREICKTPCVRYGNGEYGFVYLSVLDVIKRHRQPAAVSADARVEDMAMIIRMLVHYKDEKGSIKKRAMDYLKAKGLEGSPLRALSPETVCGGENHV